MALQYEFKDRLKEAMDLCGMRQVDLCEKTHLSKSAIHNYLTGYAKPKRDKLSIIADRLGVDPAWLMGYDVPMKQEKESKNTLGVSDEVKELLIKFNKLSEPQKLVILSTIDAFLKG